jgi:hypothetical protein
MPFVNTEKEGIWLSKLNTIDSTNKSAVERHGRDDLLSVSPVLQFPSMLGTHPRFQNFMLFHIYETSGAALSELEKGTVVPQGEWGKDIAKAQQDVKDSAKKELGGNTTRAGRTNIGNAVDSSVNIQLQTIFGGVGNASRDSLVSYNSQKLGFNQRLIKQPTSIALPIPANIASAYGMEYDAVDFTGLMNMQSAFRSLANAAEGGGGEELKEITRKITSVPATAFDSITKITGGEGANIASAVEAKTRQAPNRFKENLFKGVNRRKFDFEWEFIPRNKEDVLRIYTIIYAFKKYSHPKLSQGGLFLDYPAQFKIIFMNKLMENELLFKIGLCALTSCEVTYGGDNLTFFRPSAFEGPSSFGEKRERDSLTEGEKSAVDQQRTREREELERRRDRLTTQRSQESRKTTYGPFGLLGENPDQRKIADFQKQINEYDRKIALLQEDAVGNPRYRDALGLGFLTGASPNLIKIKLSFEEMELLTRERIEQGY